MTRSALRWRPDWRLVWLAIIAALSLMAGAQPSHAHPMPQSLVQVRALEDRWQLDLEIPSDRLATAFIAAGLVPDPGPGFTAYPDLNAVAVANYVQDHVTARGTDGQLWGVTIAQLTAPIGSVDEWRVTVDLIPPPHAERDAITLDYGVIIREDPAHVAVVSLVQDWQAGVLPGDPVLLGTMRGDRPAIALSRGEGGGWQSWGEMVSLGAWHMAEGTDHLAFLAVLLLTVTLVARNGEWVRVQNRRMALSQALWRVSAFTAGHTLALLATALGWLPEAGQGVEVAIALSVAVTAANALRPIFPRREALLALLFGLVHGTAFATTIRELALPTGQTLLAVLGFNIGIELVQLVLVALALPLLLHISTKVWEPGVRYTVGWVALVASGWWAFSRVLGWA